MLNSLFNKLLLSYLLVVFITLAVLGISMSQLFTGYYYSAQEDELQDRGEEIARAVGDYMEQGGPPEEVLQAAGGAADARVFWVRRETLEIILLRNARVQRLSLDPAEARDILRGETVTQKGMLPRYGQEVISAAVPVEVNGNVAGALFFSRPLADIAGTIGTVRKLILLAAIPAVLLAAVLGWWLSRSVSRPLHKMSRASRALAAGDFEQRVNISSRDEVGQLAADFNYLAAALSNTISDLSREKEKMENVLSNMAEGVIAVDANYNIIALNSQAVKNLELEGYNTGGLTLGELPVPREVEELFGQVLRAGETGSVEVTTGGGRQFILAHVSPLRERSGDIFGAVGVLHDISELRRLEQMRRDLVANVSHELRTPITSIGGFTEAMLDGTIESEEERQAYLNIIRRETGRLNRLIHNLLDLAALESGRTDWELHRVQVPRLVDRVLSKLKPQADEKNITLKKQVPGDLPPLLANEDRTEQVLTNLLDNAVYFSPPGEEVTVEARAGDKTVTLSVSDRGPGIPAEKLVDIWERFQRADKSRSRSRGGTGLGLAIVKQIVEAHGGEVEVQNREQGGAVFSFTMPAAGDST